MQLLEYYCGKGISNKRVSQMRVPLAVHHKLVGVQNRTPSILYVFEHKT